MKLFRIAGLGLGITCVLSALACQGRSVSGPVAATAPAKSALPKGAMTTLEQLPPLPPLVNEVQAQSAPADVAGLLAQGRDLMAKGQFAQAQQVLDKAYAKAPGNALIQRELGFAYAAQNQRDKAQASLSEAARTLPDSVRLQLLLGQYAQAAGSEDEALRHYRQAVAAGDAVNLPGDRDESLLRLGMLLEKQGYYTAALQALERVRKDVDEKAREIIPNKAMSELISQPERLMTAQGRLLLRLGRAAEAADLLEQAYRRDKTNAAAAELAVQALLTQGNRALAERIILEMAGEEGQASQAIGLATTFCAQRKGPACPRRLLEGYLKQGGRNAGFVLGMAQIMAHEGQRGEAAELLASSVGSIPDTERLQLGMADLHARMGDFVTAARELAAVAGEDVPSSYTAIGQLRHLVRQGMTTEQIQRMLQLPPAVLNAAGAKAVEEAPAPATGEVTTTRKSPAASTGAASSPAGKGASAATLAAAGILYHERNDLDQARRLLTQAIAANPELWAAQDALAAIYVEQKDQAALDEMLAALKKSHAPKELVPYLTARAYFDRGKLEEAASRLQAALLANNQHGPSLLLLARTNMQMSLAGPVSRNAQEWRKYVEVAERYYLMAGQAMPGDTDVLDGLFELYVLARQPAKAAEVIAQSLRESPYNVHSRLLLVGLYNRADQGEKARAALKELAAEYPNDVDVRLMQVRVQLPVKRDAAPIPAAQAQEAQKALGEIIRRDGRNFEAAWLSALVYVNQRQYVPAAEVLRELYRRKPSSATLASSYMDALIKSSQKDKALEVIRRIGGQADAGTVMREMLLNNLAEMKRLDVSQELLETWLAQPGPESEKSLLRQHLLEQYSQQNRFEQAQKLLDAWLAQNPPAQLRTPMRQEKMALYAKAGDWDALVAYARQWRQEAKSEPTPIMTMLALLLEGKQDERALAQVNEWLGQEKDPRVLNALWLNKALVLARLHRYQELLDVDRVWSQAAPDSPVPHASVIELLTEQKQHDWAIKLARIWEGQQEAAAAAGQKATQLDEARSSLSRALLLAGKEKEALELARRQVEKSPKDAAVLRNLYVVQSTMGNMAEAEQTLETSYLLNPDDAGINNDLGYQYAQRGIYLSKAEELVRRALELRPNEPAFRDSLGWVLYKQGRLQDAWVQFEPFVSMEDAHLGVCFDHAGDTAWRLGKKDQAIALWGRAVKSAKGEERKDTDTNRVLDQTPRKLSQARQGKSVNVAPLGQGLKE